MLFRMDRTREDSPGQDLNEPRRTSQLPQSSLHTMMSPSSAFMFQVISTDFRPQTICDTKLLQLLADNACSKPQESYDSPEQPEPSDISLSRQAQHPPLLLLLRLHALIAKVVILAISQAYDPTALKPAFWTIFAGPLVLATFAVAIKLLGVFVELSLVSLRVFGHGYAATHC